MGDTFFDFGLDMATCTWTMSLMLLQGECQNGAPHRLKSLLCVVLAGDPYRQVVAYFENWCNCPCLFLARSYLYMYVFAHAVVCSSDSRVGECCVCPCLGSVHAEQFSPWFLRTSITGLHLMSICRWWNCIHGVIPESPLYKEKDNSQQSF